MTTCNMSVCDIIFTLNTLNFSVLNKGEKKSRLFLTCLAKKIKIDDMENR